VELKIFSEKDRHTDISDINYGNKFKPKIGFTIQTQNDFLKL